jgi:polysaccharide deacetylase family protein (PEP-CTERM system associated)
VRHLAAAFVLYRNIDSKAKAPFRAPRLRSGVSDMNEELCASEPMLNALSIDVEDYFHVEAFAAQISPDDWQRFEPRIERNIALILEILSRHRSSATFFILGWIAERFPHLVRRIADAGHEIGCHGYAHQHIRRQTAEQFRQDVQKARRCLMDQVHRPVICFRAPSFSITKTTLWALDVLAEEGFKIDSSIFPVRHDLYGIPDSDRFPHWRNRIFEFPPTTIRRLNNNFGVAGGGYLRLFPYRFTHWAINEINKVERQPVMVYFHPWEIDPLQPRISAPLRSRLRHYTNLSKMQRKIERLLTDFQFSTISEVCRRFRDLQFKKILD